MRRYEAPRPAAPAPFLWAAAGALGILVLSTAVAAIAAVSLNALGLMLVGWALVAVGALKQHIRSRGARRARVLPYLQEGRRPDPGKTGPFRSPSL